MEIFENFFTDLYSDKHRTVDKSQKGNYMTTADRLNSRTDHPQSLNKDFTIDEVNSSIKALKSGKASSLDMINNEILKCLDNNHLTFLTKLYNTCLAFIPGTLVLSPLSIKREASLTLITTGQLL